MEEDHRKAKAYFNRSGQLFDSLYSEEKVGTLMHMVNRLFRSDIYVRYFLTVEHLKTVGAESVLDVGIGGAKYAKGYIESGVKKVTGVDISSTMLQFAKQHVQGIPGHENTFKFILSDIDQFESSERFDVVVAMGFFDYVTDSLGTLKRLREFCDHSVIASFPSISFWRTPIRKARYRLKKCPVFFFKSSQILDLSGKAGFTSCDLTRIEGAGMDYVAIFRK